MHDSPTVQGLLSTDQAPIRWAGLQNTKKEILRLIVAGRLPLTLDFPGWTELRLMHRAHLRCHLQRRTPHTAAMASRRTTRALWDSTSPSGTSTSKRWMRDHPERRPAFSSAAAGTIAHPSSLARTGQAMLGGTGVKQSRNSAGASRMLQKQHHVLSNQIEVTPACNRYSIADQAGPPTSTSSAACFDLMLGPVASRHSLLIRASRHRKPSSVR